MSKISDFEPQFVKDFISHVADFFVKDNDPITPGAQTEFDDLISRGYHTVVADLAPAVRAALITIVTAVASANPGLSIPAIVAAAIPVAEAQGITIAVAAFHDVTRLILNGLGASSAAA